MRFRLQSLFVSLDTLTKLTCENFLTCERGTATSSLEKHTCFYIISTQSSEYSICFKVSSTSSLGGCFILNFTTLAGKFV